MTPLFSYTKHYKKELILGPLFKLLEAIFELLLPLLMARLIDVGLTQGHTTYAFKMALLMFFMTLLGLVSVLVCQYYASVASQGFGTELRKAMVEHITLLSDEEREQFGAATLITRTTHDVNQLQLALAMFIRLVIRAPFIGIGSVIMAFYIDPNMALIFLIIVPLFAAILFVVMKKTAPLYKKVQYYLDQFNQKMSEQLTGVKVIRAFHKETDIEKETGKTADDLARSYRHVTTLSALLSPLTFLIMNTGVLILLRLGGYYVNTGILQSGQVLALVNYMMQMLLAMIVVANLVVIFTRAYTSSQRVSEVLTIKPSIISTEPQKEVFFDKDVVLNFNKVSFTYKNAKEQSLTDLSFSIPAHQSVGIIGPTGSGKSTLISLIPRFYDTTDGEILVNGKPITTYLTGELRQHIALVPQSSVLFSGTIRSNLLIGNPQATDDDCWHALDAAQMKETVALLPDQLDAPVMAQGKNFSGGQRQRLCIARALVKKPDILIMDDSLSALDYQTDFLIRETLKKEWSNMTLIVVSQRVSSIKQLDQIYVLDQGKLVASGTHEELLECSSFYQHIASSQQEEEQ